MAEWPSGSVCEWRRCGRPGWRAPVARCAVALAFLMLAAGLPPAAADDLETASEVEPETSIDSGTQTTAEGAAQPGSDVVPTEASGAAPQGPPDPVAEDDEIDPLFDESFDAALDAAPESYPDPLETSNRKILGFNRAVDRFVLDPITEAYQWAVPKPARNAVSRFFLNLGSPRTLVNDCLQLEWKDAGVTTARFVTNSTVGIVGLFDVAEHFGLPGHESDFGQTLALAGTPSGPYLLLPILGPSNLRDGFGVLVDGLFQPVNYVLGPMSVTLGPVILQSPGAILIYGGSSGLTLRDRNYAKLKDLESSSVDYYAAMRSGYYQDRVGQIWGRRSGHRSTHEPAETP